MSVVFEIFQQARDHFHSMAELRGATDGYEEHQELAAAAEQTIKHLLVANGQLIPAAAEKEAVGIHSATHAILDHAMVLDEERAQFFTKLSEAVSFRLGNVHLPFSPLTYQKLRIKDSGDEQISTDVSTSELALFLSAEYDHAPQAAYDDAYQLTRALSTIVALRKFSTVLDKNYDPQEWDPVIAELKTATRQAYRGLGDADIPAAWIDNYIGAVERTTTDLIKPTPKVHGASQAASMVEPSERGRIQG